MFVTRMLRYGDLEGHSYILGIYTTREQATFAGSVEESWRGGKYEYRVEEHGVDISVPQRIKTTYEGRGWVLTKNNLY